MPLALDTPAECSAQLVGAITSIPLAKLQLLHSRRFERSGGIFLCAHAILGGIPMFNGMPKVTLLGTDDTPTKKQ